MKPTLSILHQAIKFDCLLLVVFKVFSDLLVLFLTILVLLYTNVSKLALNHFQVNFTTKDCLRSAKNVVYFLLGILVERPKRGVPSTSDYATACLSRSMKTRFFCLNMFCATVAQKFFLKEYDWFIKIKKTVDSYSFYVAYSAQKLHCIWMSNHQGYSFEHFGCKKQSQ